MYVHAQRRQSPPQESPLNNMTSNWQHYLHKLFRRKSIEDVMSEEKNHNNDNVNENNNDNGNDTNKKHQKLQKVLGLIHIIAFGVGATVGSGIFVTAGVAAQYTGFVILFFSLFCFVFLIFFL